MDNLKTNTAGFFQGTLAGVSLLIARYLGSDLNPVLYALSYLLIANLSLLAYTYIWGERESLRLALPLWSRWGIVGLCNAGIQLCTTTGVALSGATNASVLVRTDLVFGLLLGWVLYRERARWAELLGGGLMVWGTLLVMRVSPADFRSLAVGDLLLVLAGFLTAVNAIVIKYGLVGLPGSVIAVGNTLVAGLTLTTAFTLMGGWSAPHQYLRPDLLPWLLASGLCYALTLIAYYYSLSRRPIWLTRMFSLLSPVVALIGGWMLFGEKLGLGQLSGVALVMVGMSSMLIYRAKNGVQRKTWFPDHSPRVEGAHGIWVESPR